MNPFAKCLACALCCVGLLPLAAQTVAPAAKPAVKAASSATATAVAPKANPAPKAGGQGGGVGSDSSNTATKLGPKTPKCPDPTVKCAADKVVVEKAAAK